MSRCVIGRLQVVVIRSGLANGFGGCSTGVFIYHAVNSRRCLLQRRTTKAILMRRWRQHAKYWQKFDAARRRIQMDMLFHPLFFRGAGAIVVRRKLPDVAAMTGLIVFPCPLANR